MRKIIGLILIVAVAGMLVGCESTTPEIKTGSNQPENLTIMGTVYSLKPGQTSFTAGDPLSGVVVTLSGNSQTWVTSTDANGEYSFTDLPQSSMGTQGYVIVATKDGYQRTITSDIGLNSTDALPDNSQATVDIIMPNTPIVESISPIPGTTVAASSQTIIVVFNEAMDESSVRPVLISQGIRTFDIADTQSLTTSWSADSKTLTITTGPLLANQTYRFFLDPDTRAKDLEGNLLDANGGVTANAGGLPSRIYNNNLASEDYDYRTASGGAPGAPTGLQLTVDGELAAGIDYLDMDAGSELVVLNWQTPTSGGPISGYRVYVSKCSSGPWHLISTENDNTAIFDVNNVNFRIYGATIPDIDPVCTGNAAFINYKVCFRVVAYNAEAESSAATAEAQDAEGPRINQNEEPIGNFTLDNDYILPDIGGDNTKVYIAFDEPVNLADAGNVANYTLDSGYVVDSVTVMTSYRSDLGMVGGGDYTIVLIDANTDLTTNARTLTVTGVRDLAGNSMQIGAGLNDILL